MASEAEDDTGGRYSGTTQWDDMGEGNKARGVPPYISGEVGLVSLGILVLVCRCGTRYIEPKQDMVGHIEGDLL